MINAIRKFLGLCVHKYKCTNQETITLLSEFNRNAISGYKDIYWYKCEHCGKIKIQKIRY